MPETIKKVPMRRCIACMQSKPQKELIRITYADGELKLDEKVKAEGRGCYLCRNKECIDKAIKKNAFARAYKTSIAKSTVEIIGRLINAE